MKFVLRLILVYSLILLGAGMSVASAQEAHSEEAFITGAEVKDKKVTYHIDLTKFADRYEKVRFVTELYDQDDIVVTDNDINSDAFSVTAYKRYPSEHIRALVLGLKASAERKSALMTPKQKSSWLKRHDKFQKEEK